MGTDYGAPTEFSEVLLLPCLMTLFGVALYLLIDLSERRRLRRSRWKWLAYLLVGFGLWTGVRWVWNLWNPDTGLEYRYTIPYKKVLASHYLAPVIPLIALIGLVWHSRWTAKRRELQGFAG
jgi:hypothetical protein